MDKLIDLGTGWDILLKKREAIGKKAAEMIESSEEGKCSYSKGYMTQEVFLCNTCNQNDQGSGVCVGCYLSCHLDHDVSEVGPKPHFRCDCGNTLMKNRCSFVEKPEKNSENAYNHNFLGKFCICDTEDSDDRSCDMFMCIGCCDWFHSDCIELSNNCHNHSEIHEEIIPKIPSELISHYYFICQACVNRWKFIPNAYKEYIFFESPVKRPRKENCPIENSDLFKNYPYHIFLKKIWTEERCVCETCKKNYWPEEFLNASHMEENISLLGKIQEETEKILEEAEVYEKNDENNEEAFDHLAMLPHETQIEVANGYQILKDAFEEMTNSIKEGVIDLEAVEDFKSKLQEKYQAYKKSKIENCFN